MDRTPCLPKFTTEDVYLTCGELRGRGCVATSCPIRGVWDEFQDKAEVTNITQICVVTAPVKAKDTKKVPGNIFSQLSKMVPCI